ncbi:MAG: sodium:proton antiporter [Opitutae bacterium]|nr:sodium:proton antiporter [Opitutae bacterium]
MIDSFLIAVTGNNSALWSLCFAVGAGCFLTSLSRKTHLPTLVLLLLGGFLFGPEGLNLFDPKALGDFLPIFISLAVAIILFEGGLTLDLREFTQTSVVIQRLLTVGVLITWIGVAICIVLVFKTNISFALLMGSLVIVTGPTVIVPLLRRIRIQSRIANILHWEGVLIDSIGVFIAILCFEWVVEGGGTVALPNFMIRILSGLLIGSIGGYVIYLSMERKWIPDTLINAFALASAMFIFGLTELIKPEAGLLSVTIAGIIVGIKKPHRLKEIKAFKAEIVDLLIGLLFLVLVARLELHQFKHFFSQGGLWVLIAVILIIRPLSVFLSSHNTQINFREKLLLSWIAPRGVVAASMASLFAISLQNKENPIGDPLLMEAFVYSVICTTVLLQGMSSGIVARLLRLQRPDPNDWIIIGAHRFGRELAQAMNHNEERSAILLDNNPTNIKLAKKQGLNALLCDGMEAEELYEEEQMLFGTGFVLALTDNSELNQLLMQRWAEQLNRDIVYGWIPLESGSSSTNIIGQPIFRNLEPPAVLSSELIKHNYGIDTIKINDASTLEFSDAIPLIILRGKQAIPINNEEALEAQIKSGDSLVLYQKQIRSDPNKNTKNSLQKELPI